MLRVWPACVALAFACSAALADEEAQTAAGAEPPPQAAQHAFPHGYAFAAPELLADQQVWGIAHGARLLARACAQRGHAAAAEAWVDWQEREATVIAALTARLGQHYFGRTDVPLDALAGALGLRQSLDLAPEVIEAACNTLAEALAQERYDLARRREGLLKK